MRILGYEKLDPEKVKTLAASIVEHGQKQPIGVKRLPDAGYNVAYKLIFGHYRYAALKFLEDNGTYVQPSVQAIVYNAR